ncbi:MAG TPA: hypothetical protein VEA41_07830 [Salinarimonas sp.]|jgi:hypothetical protein|nr:hypothetical protein [Salinarimonas sp.]
MSTPTATAFEPTAREPHRSLAGACVGFSASLVGLIGLMLLLGSV